MFLIILEKEDLMLLKLMPSLIAFIKFLFYYIPMMLKIMLWEVKMRLILYQNVRSRLVLLWLIGNME
jgi:hypothetical protein